MARLRIEFVAAGGGRGRLGGQIDAATEAEPLGTAAIDVLGTASVPVAVPAVAGQIFAELGASGGAVYVAVGTAPDPTVEPRWLVRPGQRRLLHVLAGQSIVAIAASELPGAEAVGGIATSVSPTLAAGEPGTLSLNLRGALRVVAQGPDGSDVDPGRPTETLPAKSGTVTVVQLSVGNAAPTIPALAANPTRKSARISYKAGGATLYWGPAAGVTATTGFPVPPGTVFDVMPGYTGDLFLVADAAGPTAVGLSQLL